MEPSRDDFVIALRSAFLKKGTQQRFSLLSLIFFSIIILILGNFNFKVINYIKLGINEIVYRSSFIVSGPENFLKKNYFIVNSHLKHYEKNKKNVAELNLLRGKDLSQQIITLEQFSMPSSLPAMLSYCIAPSFFWLKILCTMQILSLF